MCQLLVGLPTVTVGGVEDQDPFAPIVVHIEFAPRTSGLPRLRVHSPAW